MNVPPRLIDLPWKKAPSKVVSLLRGPLLGKELRSSSRRRRTYLLRLAYLVVLGIYAVFVWLDATKGFEGVGATSRMAEAGKKIILNISVFQFIVAQLLTVLLASNCISGEVAGRTLTVLLATPLSLRRLVAEKVLASLSQVLWLLAASLPLLALARVFGGVPWSYVFWSVVLTMACCMCAAAVSAYYSVRCRRPYLAAFHAFFHHLLTMGLLSLAGAIGLTMVGAAHGAPALSQGLAEFISAISPPVAMGMISMEMVNPGSLVGQNVFPLVSCLVAGLVTARMVNLTAYHLSRLDIDPPLGEEKVLGRWKDPLDAHRYLERMSKAKPPPLPSARAPKARRPAQAEIVSVVTGSPIVWRECSRTLPVNRPLMLIGIGLPLAILVPYYLPFFLTGMYSSSQAHVVPVLMLMGSAMLLTGLLSATSISFERQAQSWAILFTPPWSKLRVLQDKLAGVMFRTRWPWILLTAHLLVFIVTQQLHWALGPLVLLIGFSTAMLVATMGLFLSVLARTVPVVMTAMAAVLISLWLVLPVLLPLAGRALLPYDSPMQGLCEVPASLSPFVQAAVLTEAMPGRLSERGGGEMSFNWPVEAPSTVGYACGLVLIGATINLAASALMFWLTLKRCPKTLW